MSHITAPLKPTKGGVYDTREKINRKGSFSRVFEEDLERPPRETPLTVDVIDSDSAMR